MDWIELTGMKSEPKCLKVCLISHFSAFSGYLLSSAGTVFLLFSSCLSKSLWFSYHRWHWAPVECLERRRKTSALSPWNQCLYYILEIVMLGDLLSTSSKTQFSFCTLKGNLLIIILVSYFGAKLHRPRIIGAGCLIMSAGTFLIAMPQFFMGRWVQSDRCFPAGLCTLNGSSLKHLSIHYEDGNRGMGMWLLNFYFLFLVKRFITVKQII